MVRVILLHFDAFFVHFDKLIRRPPGPLCPPFPIPFSELIQSSIPLMTAQFLKALKVEMSGSKAKTVEAPS